MDCSHISISHSLICKHLQFLLYNVVVKVLVFHCTFSMDRKAMEIMGEVISAFQNLDPIELFRLRTCK